MNVRLWLMCNLVLTLSSTHVFAQRDSGRSGGGTGRSSVPTSRSGINRGGRASDAFVAGIIAGAAISRSSNARDFGESLPQLADAEQERFEEGLEEFTTGDTNREGLGPVFNEFACVTCHNVPAVGGGSIRLETRFGTTTNGEFDALEDLGGSLPQDHALGVVETCSSPVEFFPEVVPPQATIVAKRRTTPLFGLGLVAAVPDATLRDLAARQKRDTPATAGVPSELRLLTTGASAVGRFGWKAQHASLFEFAGDAYVNEMGVTNPVFPIENCPQGDCTKLDECNPADTEPNDDGDDVQAFADFMTLLAPPPRGEITTAVTEGESEFQRIGCANCHVRSLTTGPNAIAALSRVTFSAWSDFLLHDMGSLGDGIQQIEATGALMRTAPLWGLRKITTFLHDGRATTLQAAIQQHDGQAAAARNAFQALTSTRQSNLLAFLNSL